MPKANKVLEGPTPTRRWAPVAFLACAAALAGPTTQVAAGGPGFYSGGHYFELIESPDELVVEFESAADRIAAMQQLRVNPSATLEDVPWGPRGGRLAIMHRALGESSRNLRSRAVPGAQAVRPVYRFREGGLPVLPTGRIVVALTLDQTETDRGVLFADYQVELVEAVEGLAGTFIVEPTPESTLNDVQTAARLYEDVRTRFAHPDLRLPVRFHQVQDPNDPFYSQQFHLNNTGEGEAVTGADIDIESAWARTFGAGVRVGQLDDSCDVNHKDLADNYIGISHDISDNAQGPNAADPKTDGDRHGTPTMGLMVAVNNNGIGVSGVAPASQFTASGGLDAFVTTSQIASAYTFARNQRVGVHNNSWGFVDMPNPDVVVQAIKTAFDEGRDGLGMVICFATGNGRGMEEDSLPGVEVFQGEELSTLPTVIGVGASNARDRLASYSNYGTDIDLLAPSSDAGDPNDLPSIVTTDNTDGEFDEPGYNENGLNDTGGQDLADPAFTNTFGGTSASAPQVAGTAALILSLEPGFTASAVRNIIEHSCDKINRDGANYNGITQRSLRYGYGRLDAGMAVENTFDGYSWPRRVADVRVDTESKTIRWKKNDDVRVIDNVEFGIKTSAVLVVQGDTPFSWVPTDGENYDVGEQLTSPTSGALIGAEVVANLDAELFNYDDSGSPKYFGIYSETETDRRGTTYGFGVSVNTVGDGVIIDSGSTGFGDGGDGGTLPPGATKPNVTIEVRPLQGTSPLTVQFIGNAQSAAAIDSFLWEFGDGVMSSDRSTQHTYVVNAGTQTFTARLTATDVNGNIGGRAVNITVSADGDGATGENMPSIAVVVSDPKVPGSSVTEGTAPLTVNISAQLSNVPAGALNSPDVFWDLGDGTFATSLTVVHTYRLPGRFPITVTINSDGLDQPLRATRFIDVVAEVEPSPSPTASPGDGNANGGGGGGGITCGMGAITAFWGMLALALIRRRCR